MSNPYYPAHELDSMGAALLNPQVLSALAARLQGRQPSTTRPDLAAAGHPALAAYGYPDLMIRRPELSLADKVELSRGDDIMFGIDSGAANIAAGATATLTVAPQKRNIPVRISLSANVANNFVVTDIRVGVDPVLATVGAISAAVFIQDSAVPPFRAVVCEVGNNFSVTVTNVTGAAQRFTATVIAKFLPGNGC